MLIKELFRKQKIFEAMSLAFDAMNEDIPFDAEIYRSAMEYLCAKNLDVSL